MSIEAFCTFIFVSAVLLVKDKRSGMFSASINEAGVGFFGCALIALSLTGMVLAAGSHTSASLNPAVSIALTELDAAFLKIDTDSDVFWRVYIFGPLLGAAVAGVCSIGHSAALEEHGPQTMAEMEAERVALLKKDDNAKGNEAQDNEIGGNKN